MPPIGDLATWNAVLDAASVPLLAAIDGADDLTAAATMSALRRNWDGDLIAVAIELVRARRKAQGKFPDRPEIVADVEGVEQATSAEVAAHKARRFAELGEPILDLCCGIGGDAMALAAVVPVTAVDIDPVRAWMAGRNAGCTTNVADVETIRTSGVPLHLDPSRRSGGRRQQRYADYQPGPDCIERLLADSPDAAVKLGPGVDFDALPAAHCAEVEVISERGALVQAVLWTGRLARHRGERTATCLPVGASISGMPRIAGDASGDVGAFLFVPEPALERADLVGRLMDDHPVRAIVDGLGLLTADEPIASPWVTAFQVQTQMPWREAKIRAWLRAHDGGLVEVKTRGRAVETDAAQKTLRGSGGRTHTVFGLRLGRKVVAVIASRVAAEAPASSPSGPSST